MDMQRRLLSLLAIIGVLLHAGLFVRHNAMMVGAVLDRAALADIFSEICSGKPGSSASPDATFPGDHGSPESHCPDCLAFAGAVALLPTAFLNYVADYSIASDTPISSQVVSSNGLVLWPPGQGPPLSV
jgi:hypothetical protein